MVIDKAIGISNVNVLSNINKEKSSFKNVLEQKHASKKTAKDIQSFQLKSFVNDMNNNHEKIAKSIKTFMTRTDYSPEKLLAIQYKTGVLLLREQMFCKTAEHSVNTVKSFTQMQV